jgi:hypothetical protein
MGSERGENDPLPSGVSEQDLEGLSEGERQIVLDSYRFLDEANAREKTNPVPMSDEYLKKLADFQLYVTYRGGDLKEPEEPARPNPGPTSDTDADTSGETRS